MSTNTRDPTLGEVTSNLSPEEMANIRKLLTGSQGSQPGEPTPPQPPKPGQNADVTGSRPLHTETTPARQLEIQPSGKSSLFETRPLTHSAPSTGESSKSDDMLQAVSSYTMQSVPHHTTATYVPNSNGMYYCLAEMDKTMSHTRRWLDNSFGWIPQYSRLYYGVLYIIQVMRSQRDAGLLDLATIPILEVFEMYFNPGNQLIAGPLVPYFKALSSSKVDSDLFGNVAPKLPDSPSLMEDGTTPNPTDTIVHHHLPAIPALFDEICTLISLGHGTNDVNRQVLITGNSPGAFGTAFTAQSPPTNCYNMPGMYYGIPLSGNAADSFYTCASSYSFPQPITRQVMNAGISNWFQYCRFATANHDHYDWFARLSGTMSNYAQHFEGSIPIGDISTSSLPTGQVFGKYRIKTLPTEDTLISNLTNGTNGNTATAYYYNKPSASSLSADWTSVSMSIPIHEEWRALLTQMNCLHNGLRDNVPLNFRVGTFWSLPIVRRSDRVNPKNSIPLLIARKFHKTTRNENA